LTEVVGDDIIFAFGDEEGKELAKRGGLRTVDCGVSDGGNVGGEKKENAEGDVGGGVGLGHDADGAIKSGVSANENPTMGLGG
jgi:hypothetical protein